MAEQRKGIASKVVVQPAPHKSYETPLQRMQRLSHPGAEDVGQMVNVRLVFSDTEFYDELMSAEVLRGLLNPDLAMPFIRIAGRRVIPREKCRYLNTSLIREILILDEFEV